MCQKKKKCLLHVSSVCTLPTHIQHVYPVICITSIARTDNTGDSSIYNCSVFLLWLPSNVLISVLVPSSIPQETVVRREPPLFTAAHIKDSLTT